ncbi:MAG: OsmC family protein [Gammaproteobacteria bacterium]
MSDNNQTIVRESSQGQYAQEIIIGPHTLVADEPTSVGGNDLGPSPYDFLLTALGTCTSMTIRMYAALKQFPLERVTVKLNHEKNI